MAELTAHGVVVHHAGAPAQQALDGVSLRIERGELVAIMGSTGAGKSTLALALAGLIAPSAGQIGGDGDAAVRLVLQRPESTFLCERVIDEVALAARRRGVPEARAHESARGVLAELGLPPDIADRDPLALSGGEQRRVAIAAVLASDPRVAILDEPGAGLDHAARHELHAAIARMHAAGRTIVLITHDPAEATALAQRLIVLRAGRVAWDGPLSPVLGDPRHAAALGIDVTPEVRILHDVAAQRGYTIDDHPLRTEDVLIRLIDIRTAPPVRDMPRPPVVAQAQPGSAIASIPPLPPLIDARVRLLACALTVAAALTAHSLMTAGCVALAAGVVVRLARVQRQRVRMTVRPLLLLALVLVLLQLAFGGAHRVELMPGYTSDAPALAALLRALQATGVVLATLALSAATATTDLAAALRQLLGPSRRVGIPVDTVAFVVATGLGLVPTMSDELERLRLAQRARGIRPAASARPIARFRADAALLTPLFVSAFRRAHLLADALAVRGFDPRARVRSWRPRSTPDSDIVLLVAGIALVALSRFA